MKLHRYGGEDRVRRVIGKVAAARFVVEEKAVLQAGCHVLEQSAANAGLEPVPLVIDAQRQALGLVVLGVISVGEGISEFAAVTVRESRNENVEETNSRRHGVSAALRL